MKKIGLVLLLTFFYLFSFGQNKVSGIVYDNTSKQVLPTVVLYIPNLHKGVMTDKNGKFEIDNLNISSFKLIVSLIGYQTKVIEINESNINSNLCIPLDEQAFQTQEVIVSGNKFSLQHENALDIQSVKQNIETDLSSGFLQSLANKQGVDMISKGNGILKPVIRGLSNTNILFVENGIRKENFQFSENHPYLSDDLGIDRIEIIKGPASLLYGSDAVGGVIFLIPEKPAMQNSISGNFKAKYSMNDGGIVSSLFLKGAKKKLHFGIGASEKSFMDYIDANNKQVPNSRFNNIATKANVGMSYKLGKSDFYYSYNLMKLGLSIPNVFSKITDNSRKNNIWYQDLNSNIFALKNKLFFNSLMIDADFSYQQNNRKLNTSYDLPVFNVVDMQLSTASYNIKATYSLRSDNELIVGTQGMLQNNKNFDAPDHVIPDATKNDFSLYSLFSSNIVDKLHLLLGVRYDYRIINTLEETDKPSINKEYSNFSYSAGFTYQLTKELLVRSNFASAFRTPNIAELTQNGLHGQYFEKGNSNLLKQQNFEPDLSIHYHNKKMLFELSGFYNKINNYIFLDKTNNYTSDGVQILQYMQSDAVIKGFETGIKLMSFNIFKFFVNYSYLNAKQKNGDYLPFIPQNKIQSEIKFIPKKQILKFNFQASVHYTHAFSQSNYAYSETFTPQYELFNFHVNFTKKLKKGNLSIGAGVNNILNSVYVDHLSTLKGTGYFFQGRNIITVVKYVF